MVYVKMSASSKSKLKFSAISPDDCLTLENGEFRENS